MRNLHFPFIGFAFVILLIPGATTVSYSQTKVDSKFGEGISFTAKDTSMQLRMALRFQNLFLYEAPAVNENIEFSEGETNWLIRRARLKFDGFAYSRKLKYKMEIGLSNRDNAGANTYTRNAPLLILDAVAKWNFCENWVLWVGQTKLPGNRERVISSSSLQFVDRSLLNSEYNLDRDFGLQLHHHFTLGKTVIREAVALSQGEGRNIATNNQGGFDYTGRLEILPMGPFEDGGDYFGSDLAREQTPKLALGGSYDYDHHAGREGGQLGTFIKTILPALAEDNYRSITTLFADMMFKYKGISVMAEYADKYTDGNPTIIDTSTNRTFLYTTGTGFNLQGGYLFKCNWEVAGRLTLINADDFLNNADYQQFTLGVSKYIAGHDLKVQSDITYTTQKAVGTSEFVPNEFMVRLQMEVHL